LLRNKLYAIALAVALVALLSFPVFAQEEGFQGAQYLVQPGDTLTGIAVRFGIPVEALSSANEITNPNQLFVGQALDLPGVDWVEGVLDVRPVNLGETFHSLLRRYRLEDHTLARLGGLVSPTQVYAGSPLLLPTNIGENLTLGRAAISSSESVLGVSAREGSNPWMVVGENRLSGQWGGLAGDVVFIPGTHNPGPGALPSPLSIEVSHGNFIQGKSTVITIGADGQQLELGGELLGKSLNFLENGAGSYVAIQGVHVLADPGIYPLALNGVLASGESFELTQMVVVNSGDYSFEKINVDPSFLDPVVGEAESSYIASITAPVSPEKMWSGYFSSPTPFDIFINSYFGTRRSYNNSDYTYFHSGIDFGGGMGADVLCPANGRVVFAGPLDIRGNATVIDHGWGIYTGYWHQSEIFVNVGDAVEEGQVIGLVGNTGRSSGAHLHWEVWAGGVQVEPYDWLVELFP
jgi:murein DD-endopeptidase MepM/ murein hydrolase activator NlpD